jgi:hypothetical protein
VESPTRSVVFAPKHLQTGVLRRQHTDRRELKMSHDTANGTQTHANNPPICDAGLCQHSVRVAQSTARGVDSGPGLTPRRGISSRWIEEVREEAEIDGPSRSREKASDIGKQVVVWDQVRKPGYGHLHLDLALDPEYSLRALVSARTPRQMSARSHCCGRSRRRRSPFHNLCR